MTNRSVPIYLDGQIYQGWNDLESTLADYWDNRPEPKTFTELQLNEIWETSRQLAQSEADKRGIDDLDGDAAREAALYLYELRDEWASFDEADIDSTAYQVWLDRFFDYHEGIRLAVHFSTQRWLR